jgi:hypothetical protein
LLQDNLPKICDAIDDAGRELSDDVHDAANGAVRRQIDDAESIVSDMDSESALDDHMEAIQRLGLRVGISSERIQAAISVIESRILEIRDRETEAEEPEFTGSQTRERDIFDDDEMNDLFASLLGGQRQ